MIVNGAEIHNKGLTDFMIRKALNERFNRMKNISSVADMRKLLYVAVPEDGPREGTILVLEAAVR